jgi:hypothetical protein
MAFPKFEGNLDRMVRESVNVELTLTLRPEKLREVAGGARVNIIEAAQEGAPSAKFVTGNPNYSVTVSVSRNEVESLKASIADLCIVAVRQFLKPFGESTPLPESAPRSDSKG